MKHLEIPRVKTLHGETLQSIRNKVAQQGIIASINCINWPDIYPDNRFAQAVLGHDTNRLYILFETSGQHLRAVVDTNQGPVSADSCFEFFVSPDISSPRYWNFEFNAIGRINASSRITRRDPSRLTPEELSQISSLSSVGGEPFDEQPGKHSWNLFVAIPLSQLGIQFNGKPFKMRGNLYKCGSATSSPHYLSWSPINTEKPDFHRPEYFSEITLL